jgi:hypothetical protein
VRSSNVSSLGSDFSGDIGHSSKALVESELTLWRESFQARVSSVVNGLSWLGEEAKILSKEGDNKMAAGPGRTSLQGPRFSLLLEYLCHPKTLLGLDADAARGSARE